MTTTTTDRIERQTVVRAKRSRVWRALTNASEFSQWFGVRVDGPFTPGARIRGAVTHPGYEHLTFEIVIDQVQPERLFSWRWHPHPIDSSYDYSKEPTTLVVFELEDVADGTLLRVVESGFDQIPSARRLDAFRGNEEGWEEQMKQIDRYVAEHP
jgi:uncharacterized protein YndB with AHSA1/START domain